MGNCMSQKQSQLSSSHHQVGVASQRAIMLISAAPDSRHSTEVRAALKIHDRSFTTGGLSNDVDHSSDSISRLMKLTQENSTRRSRNTKSCDQPAGYVVGMATPVNVKPSLDRTRSRRNSMQLTPSSRLITGPIDKEMMIAALDGVNTMHKESLKSPMANYGSSNGLGLGSRSSIKTNSHPSECASKPSRFSSKINVTARVTTMCA